MVSNKNINLMKFIKTFEQLNFGNDIPKFNTDNFPILKFLYIYGINVYEILAEWKGLFRTKLEYYNNEFHLHRNRINVYMVLKKMDNELRKLSREDVFEGIDIDFDDFD